MRMIAGPALSLVAALALPIAAAASDDRIFAFGGALTEGNMQQSARAAIVGYEDNYIAGLGYQRFADSPSPIMLGVEIGGAVRLGGTPTGEIWGGGVLRHEGVAWGRNLNVATALTVGLSHISHTHRGRETFLQDRYEGDARTLFYLGPEISLSRADGLGPEYFWRLHHRSGGGRTLGNMKGAANANVLGVRYRF